MILLITGIFFFLGYGLLIFYYKRHWDSLPEYVPEGGGRPSFLTVIIPARNEEKNISKTLEALGRQSYPQDHFEIIVVDDYSTDGTAAAVRNASLPNLRLIRPAVPKDLSSKKNAIASAVAVAQGELIVATDADCLPGPGWLHTLNGFYVRNQACFIAAPVKFLHGKGMLQLFQALDFLTLQGITAASVAADFHTMCNGANLAYTKQSFRDVNGFEGIDRVATGDDMLLMYKIWKRHPRKVFYVKSPEAIMTTRPMPTWREFYMQRKRWASKTLVYDDRRILAVLAFVYLFNCFFIALVVTAFWNPGYWWFAAGYLLLKAGVEWPFVAGVARFYNEKKLMRYFLFFQPLHVFYTVAIGALSQLGTYEWKGRQTK